ncbi:hypothetical protein F503_01180 [Ophiostoma piceae UAMH 11346]|uniref:CCHC-type domain-containing protein n=1 Tax=Ophiostoma piceae (strain UAMH 11346) TaxID=1262450 RepID=S3C6H0_OPHP1|nr:hypothetical protein F503_01180 [Ophiostoma piceae UAMH 11346]
MLSLVTSCIIFEPSTEQQLNESPQYDNIHAVETQRQGTSGSMLSPTSFKGLQASIYARSTESSSSSVSSSSFTAATETSSTASSALTVPTPAPTPAFSAKTKAYYRIIRLDKHEIERRNGAGHCTYCNETGHSRRSCAAGRIMRKVPKRMLDARLRSGVCPLCGDPDDDGHCKLSCPQKQELQAALNAKREMASGTDTGTLCEGTADSALSRTPLYMDRMTRRCVPQALGMTRDITNNKSNSSTVATDSASTNSTDDEDDLIDFGDTRNASPTSMDSTTSSTTLRCPSTPSPNPFSSNSATYSTLSTSMTTFTSFKQKCTRHKQKQNHDLLDTEATEIVWGGMTLPVAKIGLGLAFDIGMDVDAEYADSTGDLIEV